ncbi:hypothetical protein Pelo_504 [Pelomyxa schiedti]|nr:hypothetical protein Pelo_504 [Pelomyxa schiedti]
MSRSQLGHGSYTPDIGSETDDNSSNEAGVHGGGGTGIMGRSGTPATTTTLVWDSERTQLELDQVSLHIDQHTAAMKQQIMVVDLPAENTAAKDILTGPHTFWCRLTLT